MFKTINNHVCQSNTDKQMMPDQDRVINLCCYINPSTMSNQQESQADIPDGYVSIQSDNGQHYLVPHFIILATHQARLSFGMGQKVTKCFGIGKQDGNLYQQYLLVISSKQRNVHCS